VSETAAPLSSTQVLHQTLVGVGALLVGAVMAYGASFVSAEAGYAGVGPNALPWLVSAVLLLCGAWLIWEARSGGYRVMQKPSGGERADWRAAGWVVAGVVANAALITQIGFVLACSLCFALAVRGMRVAEGRGAGDARQTLIDGVTGLLIAAPVFWMFTKLLAINLPGVTSGGWI